MKIALLAIVIALALLAKAEEKQLSDDEFAKKIEECQKQENATKADAETIANHGVPETDGAKCIAACVLESTGVLKDGEISQDDYAELIEKLKFDKEQSEQASKLHRSCAAITDENRCDLAEKLSKCMSEFESQNEKLNIPENLDIFKMIRKQKEKGQ